MIANKTKKFKSMQWKTDVSASRKQATEREVNIAKQAFL